MAEDDLDYNIESDESSFIEDIKDTEEQEDSSVGRISNFVEGKFSKAEDARQNDETRWLQAYRNYRGLYGPDVQFTDTERSRVFVKVTKTKTLAAYGQVIDVLFGNSKFPLSVDPTSLPEGVADTVHFEANPKAEEGMDAIKKAFDRPTFSPDNALEPGDTMESIKDRLGALQNKLEPVGDKLIEGPGPTPTSITFHPALVAAKKMQKKIHDQLEESGANKQLRLAAFELALFGTGIMKGPFAISKLG